MGRNNIPSCEEQFEVYKKVASLMQGNTVIIRTFDIGGDKPLDYIGLAPEDNPFLGYRGIRISLDRKNLFKEQLKAILKHRPLGIKIMFPMISTIESSYRLKKSF